MQLTPSGVLARCDRPVFSSGTCATCARMAETCRHRRQRRGIAGEIAPCSVAKRTAHVFCPVVAHVGGGPHDSRRRGPRAYKPCGSCRGGMRWSEQCASALLLVAVSLARMGPSRRGHVRAEQVRHLHGHADPHRVHQPSLLALLRGEGGRRQGVEAPLRDALGARAAPLRVDAGPLSRSASRSPSRPRPTAPIRPRAISTPIRFANGSRMDRYGQYVQARPGAASTRSAASCPRRPKRREPRRPSGEPNISGDWAPEQVVMVDPRGAGGGLVPLSTLGRGQRRASAARRGAPGRRAAGGTAAVRRHGADAAGREGRGGLQARGQPALQLPDHQHPVRLDLRRPGQPHHAEQGHHRHPVRPDGPEAHRST